MIQPINLAQRANLFVKSYKVSSKLTKALPLVTIPIVWNYTNSDLNEDARKLKIFNEAKEKTINVLKHRTDDNIKALRKAGIPQKDIKRYLDEDGYIINKGNIKQTLRENNINFHGVEKDISIDDIANCPSIIENMDTEEVLSNLDTSIPESLQKAVDITDIKISDGLIENVEEALSLDDIDHDSVFESAERWIEFATYGLFGGD